MIKRLLPFGLTGLVALTAFAGRAADWPQFRGVQRSGISPETAWTYQWPSNGPRIAWTRDLGPSYAATIIGQNRAYVLGSDTKRDTVYCLDAETGDEIWKFAFDHRERKYDPDKYSDALLSTPLLHDDRLYVLAREGLLLCFEAASGSVLWQRDLLQLTGAKKQDFGASSSPIVENDLLLFNIGQGGAAVHKETGKLLWKTTGMGGYASPVVYTRKGKREAALFGINSILGIDPRTGKELWRYPVKVKEYSAPSADPIFTGEALFVNSANGSQLLRLGARTPTALWQSRNLCSDFTNSVRIGNYIYGNHNNRLACLDLATGALKWQEKGLGQGSLIAADGKLIVQTERGELIVAKATPEKYQELARTKLFNGKDFFTSAGYVTPTLANGYLYCRVASGKLLCLDLRK